MPSDDPSGPSKPDSDAPRKERRCVNCGKPVVEKFRPFCSSRCRDVDLNRWLNGSYAIPVTEDDDEDGEGGSREA